ncbi:SDR family oxidoreductase [Microbacteriaceae bacterium VKM Ac-2855]|nr:SDR family oxidoreductase [Microbacteriaceae bacterium VKM Ac-2855]
MTGSVLITGAGRGLGAALARDIAALGYPVVGLGRNLEHLTAVGRGIEEVGGTFIPVVGDATQSLVLAEAVTAANELTGGLHGVIANAGIAGPTAPIEHVSDDEWQQTLDINLTGAFRLCRASVPTLIARGSGRIILVGSVTGKRPLPGRTPYAASKLGVVGLARTLAHEVGRRGVTVNVVSPWLLEGERLDSVVAKQSELAGTDEAQILENLVAGTASGRIVTNADVSATVAFLLSDGSASLTGQDFNVAAGAVMY